MPFTPFHLGPAIGFGLPLRKYLHVPTFIIANVIVDAEPLLVLVLGLNYPLHGYLHTFIFAFLTGLALGNLMFSFDRLLRTIYKAMKFVVKDKQILKLYMVTGVLGTALHVLLDSPLYRDIEPLYPFTHNPFYNPNLSSGVYSFCIWMGIIGIIYYMGLLIYPHLRK